MTNTLHPFTYTSTATLDSTEAKAFFSAMREMQGPIVLPTFDITITRRINVRRALVIRRYRHKAKSSLRMTWDVQRDDLRGCRIVETINVPGHITHINATVGFTR